MIHLQKSVPGWLEAVQLLPAGAVVLAVDQVQELRSAKQINPQVLTVLRHHYDEGQVFGGTWEENKQRARAFFATFIDNTFRQYAPDVNLVKEWNEYLANSQNEQERQARITWAKAAAEVWRDEYRSQPEYEHIRLVIASAAVGNDIPLEFAEIAVNYDCVLSYHAYSHWTQGTRDPGDWQWFSGRWATMDDTFRAAGYEVAWLFTEAGPFESVLTGWRSMECLAASMSAYVDAVRLWIRDVKTTPAFQNGRVLGFCLFTTGRAGDTWKFFWTEQPELNALARMVGEEWIRPMDSLNEFLWNESVQAQIDCGIQLNSQAALQQAIFEAGLVPVHREIYRAYQGLTWVAQAGEDLEGDKPRRVYKWDPRTGEVSWFDNPF